MLEPSVDVFINNGVLLKNIGILTGFCLILSRRSLEYLKAVENLRRDFKINTGPINEILGK